MLDAPSHALLKDRRVSISSEWQFRDLLRECSSERQFRNVVQVSVTRPLISLTHDRCLQIPKGLALGVLHKRKVMFT